MVDPGDEFDDLVGDEFQRPLLPPEDRLWRHPSELTSHTPPSPDETLLARRRWLQSTPSRSGARAAGLVGAILATGVVLAGTHLTSWLSNHTKHPAGSHATLETAAAPGTTVATMPAPGVTPIIRSAMQSLVTVRAFSGQSTMATGNGVITSAAGFVLVPAALVTGASAITIMRSDGEEMAATVTGTDKATGLAVLRVSERSLPAIRFASGPVAGALLVDIWRTPQPHLELVGSRSTPGLVGLAGGPALLQLCPASLDLAGLPTGSIVVDASGRLSAIVVAHDHGAAVAAGGPIAQRVATQLAAKGRVSHGWLGIRGQAGSVAQAPRVKGKKGAKLTPQSMRKMITRGVRVTAVSAAGAAAHAGLRSGDFIERVDGRPVTSMGALQADLYVLPPKAMVTLTVLRGGVASKVHARLRPAA